MRGQWRCGHCGELINWPIMTEYLQKFSQSPYDHAFTWKVATCTSSHLTDWKDQMATPGSGDFRFIHQNMYRMIYSQSFAQSPEFGVHCCTSSAISGVLFETRINRNPMSWSCACKQPYRVSHPKLSVCQLRLTSLVSTMGSDWTWALLHPFKTWCPKIPEMITEWCNCITPDMHFISWILQKHLGPSQRAKWLLLQPESTSLPAKCTSPLFS